MGTGLLAGAKQVDYRRPDRLPFPFVALREELVNGTGYLALVTSLLHRVRLADPTAGLWEAADFQWWSRRHRASDDYGQLFWIDRQGEPVAGVFFTDEAHGTCQCDVIIAPDHAERIFGDLWQRALSRMAELDLDAVEATVRDDDTMMLDAITSAGFAATGATGTSSWLSSGDRPGIA